MIFRKNHKKRVVGDTAMRAKPWDATSKHAASMETLGRVAGWKREDGEAMLNTLGTQPDGSYHSLWEIEGKNDPRMFTPGEGHVVKVSKGKGNN